MRNLMLVLGFILLDIGLYAQCPSGLFYSQESIDSFPIRYPDCNSINSEVVIQGEDIVSIDSLYPLNHIGGSLRIRLTNLESIQGLDSLATVNGDVFIGFNHRLKELDGFQSLQRIGNAFQPFGGTLFVNDCDSLESLGFFPSLSYVSALYLSTCPQVNSLGSFSALKSLSNLNVNYCDALINLNGLDSILNVDYLTLRYNANLSSLSGLGSLRMISSNLSIMDNPNLSDLQDLYNVDFIGSNLTITNCPSLASLSGLQRIKELTNLSLVANTNLVSLYGLDSLQFVSQNLKIQQNSELTEITSLESLFYIGSSLIVSDNEQLADLTGLDSLVEVTSITINDNQMLQSILALSAFSHISGNIRILNNPLLSLCNIPAVCNFIEAGMLLEIQNNAEGCDGPNDVVEACGVYLPCPYQVNLNSQEEIDSFHLRYPDCTEIFGNVLIRDADTDITNLNSLFKIDSIKGDFTIDSCQGLPTLEGINLHYVGGDLRISNNHLINSLAGLETIKEIGGSLIILQNENLIHLDGISGLASNLRLQIVDNISLQNISQLDGYRFSGRTEIIDNPNLSFCNIRPLCAQLTNGEPVTIGSNGSGCLDEEEVRSSCYDCLEIQTLLLDQPNGIFRAVDTISTTPGLMLSHFGLYDAPVVELNPGFQVGENATLVIKNRGCQF
ncbi:MAG: hypothetical protein IPL46_29850 [Saprospiraceae bacterium]|nr:hypothetical protein [Saprospiraceae bacterium]